MYRNVYVIICVFIYRVWASLGAQTLKILPAHAGDLGPVPGLGRFPGEGNGNPLQSSCLENPHEQRSLLGCNGVAKSQTQQLKWQTKHQHHDRDLIQEAYTVVDLYEHLIQGGGLLPGPLPTSQVKEGSILSLRTALGFSESSVESSDTWDASEMTVCVSCQTAPWISRPVTTG